MLTDAELDRLIIKEYGPNADLQWHASFARAVEAAAYERAAAHIDVEIKDYGTVFAKAIRSLMQEQPK